MYTKTCRFTSLDDFLTYYYIGMSVLIHEEDFEALAWDYFQHASADGICHTEVSFDPQAHTTRGISYQTVLSGIQSARLRAERELGISVELISCFVRHLPVSSALETFEDPVAQEAYSKGIIRGIGLDSSEVEYHPRLYKELYNKARQMGLRLTAHAGEEGPAAYIAGALDDLGVERIDHGIRLIEDPVLMRRVADSGVMLTLCPISNVVLKCVQSLSEHPIQKLFKAGVCFSLNSDDPAYFGGYLLENYCGVQEVVKWGIVEWERICKGAIEKSWCVEERKSVLLDKLKKVVQEFEKSEMK